MDKGKKGLILGIVLLALVIVGLYYAFKPEKCADYECFRLNMVECSPAIYVDEEREASWNYEIMGKRGNQCEVSVTLLMAKEGELKLTQFQGNSMECFYPLGTAAFPDEDLSVCHGQLKEDLQQRIIEKLHEYVLENLAEIKGELEI